MINEMKNKLGGLLKPSRFSHCLRVAEAAEKLAHIHGVQPKKAYIAGLLHDCGKYMDGETLLSFCTEHGLNTEKVMPGVPELLHGTAGAFLAEKEYGIKDRDIINAIENHTLGRAGMSLLEKIIFVSDFCEEGRVNAGADIVRKTALNDIDMAVIQTVNFKIKYLMQKNAVIHPDILETRNFLLLYREC